MKMVLRLVRGIVATVLSLVVTVVGLLVVVVAGAYFYAQTDGGRRMLADTVAEMLTTPETEVSIGDIGPGLPGRISVDNLVMRDDQGVWLSVDQATLAWAPLALLDRRLHVTSISAEGIRLARLPPAPQQPPAQEPATSAVSIPSLPVDVRIDDISVRGLELGEPIVGEVMTLDIAGKLSAPAGSALQTHLEARRTDQPGLQATVDGSFDPATDILAINADVSEPDNGLIARLAGLAPYPAVSLHLDGRGPLADWQGRLSAKVGDLIDIDTTIGIARGDTLQLSLNGRADIAGLVEPPVRSLVEDELALDVVVVQTDQDTYRIDRLSLQSDAIQASGKGKIDLDGQTVDVDLDVASVDESRLQPLLGTISVGQIELHASASGALALPDVVLTGSVQDFRMPDVASSRLVKLDVRARRVADADADDSDRSEGEEDGPVLAFDANIDATGFEAVDPSLAGLSGDTLKMTAEGKMNLGTMVVDLASARILSGPTQLSAQGEMNLNTGEIDAALETAIGDLSALGAALGQPLEGALRLDAKASGNVETMVLKGGTLDGAITGFSLGDPAIDEVVGDKITVSADYSVEGSDRATIDAVVKAGEALNLEVGGKVSDGLRTLLMTYNLKAERLAIIGNAFGIPIAGELTVSGTAEGDPANPSVTATATLKDARYEDFTIDSANLDVSAQTVVAAPSGELSLTAKTQAGPVDVSTKFASPEPNQVNVSSLSARVPGLTLEGNADVDLTSTTATGRLQGTLAAANGVDILGNRIQGRGTLDLKLDASGGSQNATVDLGFNRLMVASGGQELVRAGSITLKGSVNDATGTPRLDLKLNAAAIGTGEMTAESVTATVQGPLSGADFRIAVKEFGEPPATVTTAGTLAMVGEEIRVTLAQFAGSYGEIPFSLRQRASIVYAAPAITIRDLALNVSSGQVSADGTIGGAATAATIRITGMPAALAGVAVPDLELEGTVSAEAQLRAQGGLIGGTVVVTADNIVQRKGGIAAAPPIDARVDVTLEGGAARAQGRIAGIGESPLTFSARMPLAIDAATLAPRARQTTPLEARVNWQGDVKPLMQVLPIPDQQITGDGRIDVSVTGTVEAPIASGQISIRNGSYEHLIYGTLIKNLDLAANVEGGRTVRLTLSGTDGGSGTISARGEADLADLAGEPIAFTMQIRNMTLVRRDDITASASGNISYDGTLTSGLAQGQIQTERVEVRLVDQLPPSVAELDVIEVRDGQPIEPAKYTPPEETGSEQGADGQQSNVISLDLTLRMPARVFVGGRGLESEWGGTLYIKGTLSSPRVVGSINAIRGTFDFAGRQFDVSDSSITFDGGRKINPKLDIKAQYQGDQFTAIISVTGTPDNPQLSLSSNPALPQSEILPQVLFGKSSSQLSPGEAVEIALALDTLARGGGFGERVTGKLKQTLGLANLSFGTDAEGDPTVSAGRYIGDRIYVETVQGAQPGSSKYRAEVELTDQLSVEAETGDPADESGEYFGLKWQYDY